MRLNQLRDNQGARKPRIRIGRGEGSRKGKTGGRGLNGQKSRSGVSLLGFEGGQMPLYRRVPKRGFNNISKKAYDVVNVGRLEEAIKDNKLDAGNIIDAQTMMLAGLVSGKKDGVRLLGKGELVSKLDIHVAGASKSAIKAVEEAGGKVTLPTPTKVILGAREQSAKLHAKKKGKRKGNAVDGASDASTNSEETNNDE